jgi:hypothetical protein
VRALAVAAAGLAAAGLSLAVAIWPVTVCLTAAVVAIVALAVRRSAWALAGAVLLFGFEGSIKILLGLEQTPLPGGNRAVGAFAIDLALFAAVAGLVLDRGFGTLRSLWSAADSRVRAALLLLAAWIVLSVAQIAQGGDLRDGLEAFRLLHAYTLVAVGAAIAVPPRIGIRGARVALAIGLVVALYAAVRFVIGAAYEELVFVLEPEGTTKYGTVIRGTGSFSAAVGLISFCAPLAAFGLVAGYLIPRLRWIAWPAAALAVVGIVSSYGRAPLFAVGLGLVFALVATYAPGGGSPRRRIVAVGLVVAALAAMYGGMQVAGQAKPELQVRAEGVIDPVDDASVQGRFENWQDVLGQVGDKPLGHGLGTFGTADRVSTDSSFVTLLFEQGIPVAALFLAGVLVAIVAVTVRLRRLGGEARPLGIAALAGFVAFLCLGAMGEYLEQPGKALGWGLLGVALAQALGGASPPRRRRVEGGAPLPRRLRDAARREPPGRRILWAGVAAVLVLVPVGLSQARQGEHSASIELVPLRVGPFAPDRNPDHHRSLFRDPLLHKEMVERASAYPWDYGAAALERRGGGLLVSLTADTPREASRRANALGHAMVAASVRRLGLAARKRAEALASRLDRQGLPAPARLRLERERRALTRLARSPQAPVWVAGPAVVAAPAGWADRVADAAPGDLPARPSPVWAGLAGGALALTLWLVALGLRESRLRP